MDGIVRLLSPTHVDAAEPAASTHLWVRVHAYLGRTIPLAALLRAPWTHLRENKSLDGSQGTIRPPSNVLPFRRRPPGGI